MPVACSSASLTGSSGAVYFTPAATKFCLLAADFDDSGNTIDVGYVHDFRVGDPVVFTVEGTAKIDTGLTAGQPYSVATVVDNLITLDGVTIAGDGTDGNGHINIMYSPAATICEVGEFSLDYSRTELDVSTLPCGVSDSAGGNKWALIKKTQPGPAEVGGTLTLYLTNSQSSLGNRLQESVHLNNQDGASVKLYLDAVSDGATPPQPDDVSSKFVAGDVQFMGWSVSVNPDDPTQSEVAFKMTSITHWIGQSTV